MREVPELVKLQDKFKDQGFTVLAISNEAPGTIESAGITKHKITYPVGAVSKEAFGEYGIRAYPTVMLVDPDGKIESTSARGLGEAQVTELVKKVLPRKIDRELHKSVQKAGKNFDAGEYGKAWEEAGKVLTKEGVEEAEKADATYVQELVQKHADRTKKRAEAMESGKEYRELLEFLDTSAKTFKGMPVSDEFEKKNKELKKDKDVQKEIKAANELDKLKEEAKKAGDDEKKKAALAKKVAAFIKKHEGTKAAGDAAALVG